MKKIIIAISSIWLLAVSSAMSSPLERLSVGISGNMGVYAATGTEKNYNSTGASIDTTTKEHGAFVAEYASVFVELSLNDHISVGLDYVPQTIETPQNISREGGAANTVEAHFEDLTTVYAKLNLPLGGTYLKVGYSTVDVISKEIMSSGTSYGDDKSDGMTVGLGYDLEVSNGFSVRAEVTGSDFSDVNASNGQTDKNEIIIEEMIGARGTISIVKSF